MFLTFLLLRGIGVKLNIAGGASRRTSIDIPLLLREQASKIVASVSIVEEILRLAFPEISQRVIVHFLWLLTASCDTAFVEYSKCETRFYIGWGYLHNCKMQSLFLNSKFLYNAFRLNSI